MDVSVVHVLPHLVVTKGGLSSQAFHSFKRHRLETKEEPVKRDDTLVAPIRGCPWLALDGLLFSFEMMKLWKACEESRPS